MVIDLSLKAMSGIRYEVFCMYCLSQASKDWIGGLWLLDRFLSDSLLGTVMELLTFFA